MKRVNGLDHGFYAQPIFDFISPFFSPRDCDFSLSKNNGWMGSILFVFVFPLPLEHVIIEVYDILQHVVQNKLFCQLE
jgi:hypothetical protein